MQTLVPVPMSSKLALSMLQQCTAESEEKSVVESMLEVVESLLALLRSLLAGEILAPFFGRPRKFARCGGHRSPESILVLDRWMKPHTDAPARHRLCTLIPKVYDTPATIPVRG